MIGLRGFLGEAKPSTGSRTSVRRSRGSARGVLGFWAQIGPGGSWWVVGAEALPSYLGAALPQRLLTLLRVQPS